MAVTKVGTGTWHSSLAGRDYDSEVAAKHYDNLVRMSSRPESEGSKLLASLSTEQIRELHDALNIEAEAIQGNLNWKQVQLDFVAAHPDYVANSANGSALSAVLEDRGLLLPTGVYLGTMEDIENAYIEKARKGVLQLRPGAKMPEEPFNEADAYALPLDELEKRVRGW